MRKTSKFISFAAAAALLLSGCGAGTPAPAVSDSGTTTSAAETTTAEVTTTSVTTTTTITTTAESEPVQDVTGIRQLVHSDTRDVRYFYTNRSKIQFGDDKNLTLLYYVESNSGLTASGEHWILTAKPDEYESWRKELYTRTSSISYNETVTDELKTQLAEKGFIPADKFPTAYEIEWDDPVIELDKNPVENKYIKDSDTVYDITLGYSISEPVKVNAFLYQNEDTVSVLIDPCYMYGLPMLSGEDLIFSFDGDEVISDSLLLTGTLTEGVSLDVTSFAYAQVILDNFRVEYTKTSGYNNTCGITEINVIDTFTDVKEYALSENDEVISGVEKDPVMQEVYSAVMNAKDDIYTEKTQGIVLLDMDFDGKPEVLVTDAGDINPEIYYYDPLYTAVYRVEDGKLKYIDTMTLMRYVVYYDGGVIGETSLPDGTKGWYVTAQEKLQNDDGTDYVNDVDVIVTLDGDKLTEHRVFTSKPADTPLVVNGAEYTLDWYLFDEKIVPEIIMVKAPYSEEDAPEDYEAITWGGKTSYFGEMWELIGFLRADWCEKNVGKTYSLYSDWLSDGYNSLPYGGKEYGQYDLSEREFAHHLAYTVDDYFLNGNDDTEHKYWFLGDYAKPVIYLYPEEQTDISVQVNFPYGGELTCTYPDYGDGWSVTAMPDGTLYDANGDEYYCLYWEGKGAADFDMSKGFCVAGKDTAKFLREKLMYIGLTAREANEFIIYWLPKMQDNPYNVITLHTVDYARSVPLDVSPMPDTQIRVFMTYYSSDTPVDIQEQELPHYERSGFTLVEWGGSEG